MVSSILKEDKPEHLIYEYLCESDASATIEELREKLTKGGREFSLPRLRHALMRMELYGLVHVYERKDNELVVVLKARS
ncbi:MAG: hypothetical protein M1357_00710 [Candidatus Marsarchaeota archaeon]|nr:hypothetical protein [Candidatus Marsarchaeota archaeon]